MLYIDNYMNKLTVVLTSCIITTVIAHSLYNDYMYIIKLYLDSSMDNLYNNNYTHKLYSDVYMKKLYTAGLCTPINKFLNGDYMNKCYNNDYTRAFQRIINLNILNNLHGRRKM